jgi:hypothetical protein
MIQYIMNLPLWIQITLLPVMVSLALITWTMETPKFIKKWLKFISPY